MSRKLPSLVLGLSLIASGVALGASALVLPAAHAIEQTDSAMTKNGTGEFADLEVTLSQTEGLVNQIIEISWSGGRPTKPGFGDFYVNYLQIMQCWGGTAQSGPPREQCQYGTKKASGGGNNSASRQMNIGSVVDPNETKYDEYAESTNSYIPFRSVTGKETRGEKSEFFDKQTSNEVNFGRIRSDGTGENYFEVQTGIEAPGLGCGQVRNGETPLCWIVVVPRGTTEVDGSERGNTGSNILETSPLLQSNWDNRILFPLEFQPVGANCAFGSSETALLGSDRVVESVTRWQPALCQAEGTNYSYTILSDELARGKLLSDKSDLVFVNYPVPEDEADPTRPITYAPVALSGLTIAFNVESQSSTLAAKDVRERDGQRLTDLKINARLAAKLLTQSYRYDAAPNPEKIAENPWDLAQDPEFLKLNPQFAELRIPALGHMITTLGETDSARLVWEWVWGDKDAREFLKGEPDPWGMTINPSYIDAGYPRVDYPRTDNVCVTYQERPVALCTFDLFPYAGDIAAAARAASRGDTMSRGVYNPAKLPPGYSRTPAQEPGKRAMIVITDTALADRFALTPAALLNAAGEYVLPSERSMRIAADAAVSVGVDDVVQPDPAVKVKGAYPLTSYTYAATTPATLSDEQAEAYAGLLSYVATDGQVLGNELGRLPYGYVPLSEDERRKTEEAAVQVVERAGDVLPAPETGTDASTGSGTGGTSGIPFGGGSSVPSYSGATSSGSSSQSASGATASGADSAGGDQGPATGEVEEPTPDATTEPTVETTDPVFAEAATETLPTPAAPVGSIRYVAVILVIAGGLALLVAALVGRGVVRRT